MTMISPGAHTGAGSAPTIPGSRKGLNPICCVGMVFYGGSMYPRGPTSTRSAGFTRARVKGGAAEQGARPRRRTVVGSALAAAREPGPPIARPTDIEEGHIKNATT